VAAQSASSVSALGSVMMSMRRIVLLLVVLGALLLYITKVEMVKDEAKRAAERPLERVAATAIAEVTISSAKGAFTLINSNPRSDQSAQPLGDASLSDDQSKQWSLRGVPDSRLDRGALNAMLSAIRSIILENPLAPEEIEGNLAVYGLAQPELSIAVTSKTSDGSLVEHRYELGKLNEYVSKRYIKVAAAPTVYLVPNDLFLAANKDAADLRDVTPVDLDTGALRRLTVRSTAAGGFTLERDDGVWRISSPGPFLASQGSVDSVLREIRNIKATRFIDGAQEALAQYGLATPTMTVESELGESSSGVPMQLTFGRVADAVAEKDGKVSSSKPRFYMSIKGQAPIFEIGYDPVSRIAKSIKDLRERNPIKIDTELLAAVSIVAPGREEVRLERQGEEWKVNSKATDEPFVREFLGSVAALSAIDFPSDGTRVDPDKLSAKLILTQKPSGSVEMKEEGQPTKIVVRVGGEISSPIKGYIADIEGVNETFIISPDSFRKITPRVETLLKSDPSSGESAHGATEGALASPSAAAP